MYPFIIYIVLIYTMYGASNCLDVKQNTLLLAVLINEPTGARAEIS